MLYEFTYKQHELFCEDLKIKDIAKEFGTPLYLYSYKMFEMFYHRLYNSFAEVNPLICFSVKSNSNLTILKELIALGSGLDIVSGGELYRALKAGADPEKIVYAGVGKTKKEIKEALDANIKMFNVESKPELELISEIACEMDKQANVCLRVNPDVDPKTHKYITTGKKENKFGLDFETALCVFEQVKDLKNITIKGLHCHIGSQIVEVQPFVDALLKLKDFIEILRAKDFDIEVLNLGGGLGIVYHNETPKTPEEFAQAMLPIIKELKVKEVLFEPGRYIAGNSGILVTQVQYIKDNGEKKFVIVDSAMNDLARPSLYDAYHKIAPIDLTEEEMLCDIVGPVCESGDTFAKDRTLPIVKKDDYLALMSTGAYGFVMSSNYNSRCRPAEVLVKDGKAVLIRERETYEDLVKKEQFN